MENQKGNSDVQRDVLTQASLPTYLHNHARMILDLGFQHLVCKVVRQRKIRVVHGGFKN